MRIEKFSLPVYRVQLLAPEVNRHWGGASESLRESARKKHPDIEPGSDEAITVNLIFPDPIASCQKEVELVAQGRVLAHQCRAHAQLPTLPGHPWSGFQFGCRYNIQRSGQTCLRDQLSQEKK